MKTIIFAWAICWSVLCGNLIAADAIKITPLSKSAKLDVVKIGTNRANPYKLSKFPEQLKGLPCVAIDRGYEKEPGLSYQFTISKPAIIYILVHKRGGYAPEGWTKTNMKSEWEVRKDAIIHDDIYMKEFPAGKVVIPAHSGIAPNGIYGAGHMAVIKEKAD